MKNLTTSQAGGSANAASLMWLKIEGCNQNDSTSKYLNDQERRTSFNNEESLMWLKRSGNAHYNHFINSFISKAMNLVTKRKSFAIGVMMMLLSMFVFAGAFAQALDDVNTALNVTCNGGSDGSIDLSVTGGTPPYSYIWSNGSTTQDLSGLNAGIYTVIITDDNASTLASSITITEPAPIIILDSIISVTCNGGNNGSISLNVTGGTVPYTYSWSNGSTNQNNSNLSAGTYSVNVTDANGCASNANITITQPSQIIILDSIISVTTAGGSNGAIYIIASGGNPSYNYLWSNGATTQNITGLTIGTYTVTVIDASGCTTTFAAGVIQQSTLPVGCVGFWTFDNNLNDISQTNNSAIPHNGISFVPGPCGAALSFDGIDDFLTIPHTSAYEFGLGEFTVAMRVKYTSPQPYPNNQPYAYASITDKLDPGCPVPYNGINMFLDASPTYPNPYQGGALGRTKYDNRIYSPQGLLNSDTWHCLVYTRNPDPNGTTCTMRMYVDGVLVNTELGVGLNDVTNQSPITIGANSCLTNIQNYRGEMDNYGLFNRELTVAEIIDLCNCENILNPMILNFNITACGDSACVVPNFLYSNVQWNFPLNSTTACTGGTQQGQTYTVTVTNAVTGLAISNSITIPTITATVTQATAGQQNGGINLSINWNNSNCEPLTFLWSNSSVSQNLSNVGAGTYCVTITDACGNTFKCCYTVASGGNPLAVHFTDDCDSSLCAIATGGVPPYSYQWNTIPVQIGSCINNVAPCTDVTVTVIDALGSVITVTHKKAYMTAVITNLTCNPGNGAIDFSISCIDPNCYPITYLWSNGETTEDITGLPAGIYCVTVTDACGNQYHCCYEVKCSCPLWSGCINRTFNVITNQEIFTTVFNGTLPAGCSFTYHWYDNAYPNTNYNYISSSPTYTVGLTIPGQPQLQYPLHLTVTNCCGDSITITYSPIVITLIGNNPCCSPNDGSIAIGSVTGGSACLPFSYLINQWQVKPTGLPWTNISSPNNLAGGLYRLKVTDCCGNVAYKNITLTAYQYLTVTNITYTHTTQCTPYNGTIGFTVNGMCAPGSLSYNYTPFPNCFSCSPLPIGYTIPFNSNGSSLYQDLAPGTYVFTVSKCTGGGNNSYTFTVVINFPAPVIKFRYPSCNTQICIEPNACCGVTYLWSNGSTQECQATNATGVGGLKYGLTYTVTITDCQGQTATRSVKIPKVNASIVNANGGGSQGVICLTLVNFQNGPYNILWTGTSQTALCIYNLASGIYCVTITNTKGDKWECCYTVTGTPPVSFLIASGSCRGNCITVLTGTPPYTYEWKECNTGIVAGTSSCLDLCGCYIVKVTDKNGNSASIVHNISGVKINSSGSCGLCADVCGVCAPYNYLWSNGETTQCINCLSSGTYTVTVTNCNGSTYSCSKSITVAPLSAQLISVQQPAGNIKIKVKGGCLPYTCHYSINNQSPVNQPPPGTSNPFTFNIPNYTPNDWYTVTINDACGTTVSAFQFYARTAQNGIDESNALPNPVLAPNPNNGIFNVQFADAWENINVEYQVLDLAGKEVLHGKIAVDGSLVHRLDMSDKPRGLYMIHFTSMNKSWTNKVIIQ